MARNLWINFSNQSPQRHPLDADGEDHDHIGHDHNRGSLRHRRKRQDWVAPEQPVAAKDLSAVTIAPGRYLRLMNHSSLQLSDDLFELQADLLGDTLQLRVLNRLHRSQRVNGSHVDSPVRQFLNNDVAREHGADLGFGL